MKATPSNVSLIATVKEVKALLKEQKVQKISIKHPHLSAAIYIKNILSESWTQLAQKARIELRENKQNLEKLATKQLHYNAVLPKIQILSSSYQKTLKSIVPTEDWKAIRKSIVKHLVKKGKSEKKANEVAKRVETINENDVKNKISLVFENSINHLHHLTYLRLVSAMGSTLALCVARFNENAKNNSSLSGAKAFCTQSEKKIAEAQKQVWTCLKQNDIAALEIKSTDLTKLAANLLMNKCLKYAAAISAKRRKKISDKIEDDQLALQLGELIRLLLFSIALGKQTFLLSKSNEQSEQLKIWLGMAKKLPFNTQESKLKNTPISSINSKPKTFENKFITIEGTIKKVTIKHRGRKAISSAQVTDEKGNSVTVVIPYIKLDSGGMVAGSYINISGVWKNNNKETEQSALLIDRLSLKELSKKSWLNWVKFELTSIFQTTPHALNAKWSWELGPDGAGNQLRYNMWYNKKGGNNGNM